MNVPMHEFVLANLEAVKGEWLTVAEGSGVSISTIRKIARRRIADPGVSLVQKLADYFRANPPRVVQLSQGNQVDTAA